MTLDEIFKTHTLGETKVRKEDWIEDKDWFKPIFKSGKIYAGHLQDTEIGVYGESTSVAWQIYSPPKPKVMRAHYNYRLEGFNIVHKTSTLLLDDREFKKMYGINAIAWFTRLTEEECED